MDWTHFQQTPWRNHSLYAAQWTPDSLPPAMLSKNEKEMLYWLGAKGYNGQDWIVDAGCFLGGSTFALATGFRDHPQTTTQAKIVSYDLFVTPKDPYTRGILGPSFEMGDSFKHVYEQYISKINNYVSVEAGNFKLKQWNRGPIDILFIDIAKCWETNQVLINQFFPALEIGSCVVQQDYRTPYVPWVHFTMELMRDYFEPVQDEGSSIIYRVIKKPKQLEQFSDLRNRYSLSEKREIMEASIITNPHSVHLIEGAIAMLIFMESSPQEAFEYLNVIKSKYIKPNIIAMLADVEKMFQVWITGDALENEMNTKFERYARK